MKSSPKRVVFSAISLRPSGGLTVAKLIIEALVFAGVEQIVVYTGHADGSAGLKPLFDRYPQVIEKKFLPSLSPLKRYIASKFFFPLSSLLWKRNTRLISINYYTPAFAKQLVYHINLSLFIDQKTYSLSENFRRLDARIACRLAHTNLFESEYLLRKAKEYSSKIKNPKMLYVGYDPIFRGIDSPVIHINRLVLVSSAQPHKDNETSLKVLKRLYEIEPETNWQMTVVGGQNVNQWENLRDYALSLGIGPYIEFKGPINKQSLTELLCTSLCLISSSKIESFCMVAIEAMASKCPAITTNSTSMPESVGNAGLTVDPGDIDGYCKYIVHLKNEPGYRADIVEKGIEWSRNFTPKIFQSELRSLVSL